MLKKSITYFSFILLIGGLPQVLRAANNTAQDYDDMGTALAQRGLYERAIQYYQQAVQADPTDWQAYQDMGDAYSKMSDNPDALSAYQKSLQINPNNPTVSQEVSDLQSAGVTQSPSTAQDQSNFNSLSQDHPGLNPPATSGQFEPSNPVTVNQQPSEVIVQRRRPWRQLETQPVYTDNLAPINHAKYWIDLDLAYNWSNQADLFNGVSSFNTILSQNPSYTGSATMDHGGLEGGIEFGFLINPYTGIAIGIRGVQTNSFESNLRLNNGNPTDFETVNIQPYVVPLTLDYYLFLPDHDGRFYLTAGVGYYFAVAYADDNYSYANSNGPTDEITGNMYGGNVGFQLGIGRDFELSRRFALRLFARGRYCKISELTGNFSDANGNYDNYGLVVFPNGLVGADSTGNLSGSEHYATLDYTGFDIGAGLTFF